MLPSKIRESAKYSGILISVILLFLVKKNIVFLVLLHWILMHYFIQTGRNGLISSSFATYWCYYPCFYYIYPYPRMKRKICQIFSFYFRAVSDELGRVQHLKKTTEAKLAQRMSKMFAWFVIYFVSFISAYVSYYQIIGYYVH